MLENQARKQFAELKKVIPTSTSADATEVVECVAYSLIAVLSRQEGQEDWEVVLFEHPMTNAMALPGGKIAVNHRDLQSRRKPGHARGRTRP